jgi:hypothetical protein
MARGQRGITMACARPPTRLLLSSFKGTGRRVMPGVGRLKAFALLLNGGNDGENYRDRWGLFQEQT